MKLYLAGACTYKNILKEDFMAENKPSQMNILESFFYIKTDPNFPQIMSFFDDFLLDSGAFSFIQNSKITVKWEDYVREYAEYINKYDIKKFFELDIDSIVGIKEVERLRVLLELLTKKKPIPVWHFSRGKEYFQQMCKEYPYVALGGIVSKEIPIKIYEKYFPWFIETAHSNNVKIHGLGYTRGEGLRKYHFDSVDSTAWLQGNRAGFLFKFNPNINKFFENTESPENKRLKHRESSIHNFREWRKFQKYADKYL